MPVDISEVRRHLARRDQERRQQLDIRFAKATSDCAAIVDLIATRCHPRMIVQWGSLLDRAQFTEVSDIDIAVEGIATAEAFFELVKRAEGLTTFPLDIVQLDKIDPLNRESILRKGRVVYEREPG